MKLYSRKAALRVAARARRAGVPAELSTYIALAARKFEVPYAIAYALFEQESNFQIIYGHDAGGLFAGLKVTHENYRRFRKRLIEHGGLGANGVGLGQITYWGYIKLYVGLWKPRVQIFRSLEILAGLMSRHDIHTALGGYNGGEGNPNMEYASEVFAKATKWRSILRKKGSK